MLTKESVYQAFTNKSFKVVEILNFIIFASYDIQKLDSGIPGQIYMMLAGYTIQIITMGA